MEILKSKPTETLIRSALQVTEKTKVKLIEKDYTGIGIVKSCRRDGENFILRVFRTEESLQPELPSRADPGTLVVDGFLTEEQETKILEGLQDCFRFWHHLAKLLWSSLVFVFIGC